ncbi:sugar ABC transporter ATP-binding protein [Aeromicrobium sp. P5_D10]
MAVLRLQGVRVAFGSTLALAGVDLDLEPGRVHALLGGNGSGKSTLIKVLAGVVTAEDGRLERGGQAMTLDGWSAGDAHRAGIHFVHQDLGLFAEHTVAENFSGSSWPTRGPQIRWTELHARARKALDALEVGISTRAVVASLSPAQRALVAIARAFAEIEKRGKPGVLVLDEPSATLPDHEMQLLVDRVRRIAAQGHAVIYVSHRLEEIRAVADDVTVLRDGHVAGRRTVDSTTVHDLLTLVAGDEMDRVYPAHDHQVGSEVRLAVTGLSTERVERLDLEVRTGEIVGIAGLEGCGAPEALRALFGLIPSSGTVAVDGVAIDHDDPTAAMDAGIGFVPSDRLNDGVLTGLGVHENVSVGSLRGFWRRGRFATHRYRVDAERLLDGHGVRRRSGNPDMSTLSGGNQQKVVMARWLRLSPRVLLLDDPTQGVDVKAKSEIWGLVRQLTDHGSCVVVHSTDYEELVEIADRIAVMAEGRLVAILDHGAIDRPRLTALTYTSPSQDREAS